MPAYGIDQDADDVKDGTNTDPDDIAPWMAQRQQDVANRDQNIAAGQNAWAASTASGDNLQAPNPDDVRALGADAQGQDAAAAPIKRGDKAALTDKDYAGAVYNETRALNGPAAQQARIGIAHVIMNGDERWGNDRPVTATVKANPSPEEAAIYRSAQEAVATARAQRAAGVDPTDGAFHYNFRGDDSRGPWKGKLPLKTQVGPINNAYTKGNTPWPIVYSNTYQDE